MDSQANSSHQDQVWTPCQLTAADSLPATIVATLRLEGFAICATSIFVYANAGYSWLLFSLLFFSPDVSFIGYLMGPRIGAALYNLFHSYVGAAALWVASLAFSNRFLGAVALVWIAHIGFDRALGYGLKFITSFNHTHLGLTGRSRSVTA